MEMSFFSRAWTVKSFAVMLMRIVKSAFFALRTT